MEVLRAAPRRVNFRSPAAGGTDPLGCFENTADTLRVLLANPAARATNGAYLGCLAGYNMAAIHLTFELEAVWRSILENFRPVGVWAFGVALFAASAGQFGEPWTRWSWLQLAGAGTLLLGTATYNGSFGGPAAAADAAERASLCSISPLPEYGRINAVAQDHTTRQSRQPAVVTTEPHPMPPYYCHTRTSTPCCGRRARRRSGVLGGRGPLGDGHLIAVRGAPLRARARGEELARAGARSAASRACARATSSGCTPSPARSRPTAPARQSYSSPARDRDGARVRVRVEIPRRRRGAPAAQQRPAVAAGGRGQRRAPAAVEVRSKRNLRLPWKWTIWHMPSTSRTASIVSRAGAAAGQRELARDALGALRACRPPSPSG